MNWLTFYLALLFSVPSGLVVSPLGGAGSPAQLVGLLSLALWALHHVGRSRRAGRGRQPVRWAFGVFALCVCITYAHTMLHPISSDEVSTADLAVLGVLAWGGTILISNDGIESRSRLDVLIRRLALAGGLLALLGIVQFIAGRSFVDQISIPGLTAHQGVVGSFARDQFTRPAGTAVHPIEYGVVLAMLLPFALHRAFHHSEASRLSRWSPAVMIALVVPLSLSRSVLVGTAVCLLVLVPTWTPARGRLTIVAAGMLSVVMFVAVPGLLGTLSGLFTGIGSDSSARSRTGSYEVAWEFIQRAPALGRGLGTFLPRYRILDNQLLLMLIEIGVVGLLSFLALIGVAITAMARIRRTSRDPQTRDLAQSIIASAAAGLSSVALFDEFSFPMAAGTFFFVLGLAGALWRLRAEPSGDRRTDDRLLLPTT